MFSFATCDKERAFHFIRKMYPDRNLTREYLFPLLKLVEKDIIRVQDPDFHQPCRIIEGTNFTSGSQYEVDVALNATLKNAKTEEKAMAYLYYYDHTKEFALQVNIWLGNSFSRKKEIDLRFEEKPNRGRVKFAVKRFARQHGLKKIKFQPYEIKGYKNLFKRKSK